ncbi:MAG: hypothetical protein WBA61_04390 [Aequorivita sp.]
MKIISITISKLLILLVFVFICFNKVSAQGPKPDKSTADALSSILNGPKSAGKYEYDDRSSIQKSIQTAFIIWNQKGEFEKQADYEVRIQKQSQTKFTEICIQELKKKMNSFSSSDLNINLLTYDAENEVFPTVFKFKGREWKNQVKISIDKAQNFKEREWANFRWQKEESSWCFIYNDMFPSKIYLKSNSFDITFKLPLSNQEEITISFNDLKIENPYLKDFIFNYSTAMEKEREDKISSPDGIPSARIDYETGRSLDGNGNYQLGGRIAIFKKINPQKCNESGTVVVSIEVDRNGKVISATPGVRGTTNNSRCLLEPARTMALETKFNNDPKAPMSQTGKIIYRFSLSD